MNPQICKDIFTVRILLHVDCHFDINAADQRKVFAAKQGVSIPFTVGFIYILGTDYIATHANFGFFSEYPTGDAESVYRHITITGETWNPVSPDVARGPAEELMGVYSAIFNFPSTDSAYNMLLSTFRYDPQFEVTLGYNQGV